MARVTKKEIALCAFGVFAVGTALAGAVKSYAAMPSGDVSDPQATQIALHSLDEMIDRTGAMVGCNHKEIWFNDAACSVARPLSMFALVGALGAGEAKKASTVLKHAFG